VPNIRTRASGSRPPYRAILSRWPARESRLGVARGSVTFESNRSVRRAGGRRRHYLGVVPSVSLRMVYGWRVFRKRRRYWTRLARGCRSRNGWALSPQEAHRLTQGSLAWASTPVVASLPLSVFKRDRAGRSTIGSENHDGSSSSRTLIRRTLVCGLWRLGPLPSSLMRGWPLPIVRI